MNKKFMRIKRMVIPVITLTIVASQLMGCAAEPVRVTKYDKQRREY